MEVLAAIWFLLPAGLANMAPVVVAYFLPAYNLPVDFGRSLRGRRLFGSHKTWRGLIAGVVVAFLAFALQKLLYEQLPVVRAISRFDYASASPFIGIGMGVAALGGDLIKSLFKRQVDIQPGQPWFPFDQCDWLIGVLAFASIFTSLSIVSVAFIFLVGFALHLLSHFLGYVLGLNSTRI